MELFFSVITFFLTFSCVFFIPEIRKETPVRINAQDFFIYGFMSLMLVVIVQLIVESVIDCIQKAKEVKRKKQKIMSMLNKGVVENMKTDIKVSHRELNRHTENNLSVTKIEK